MRKTLVATTLVLALYSVGAGGALALFRTLGMFGDTGDRIASDSRESDRQVASAFWPITVPIYGLVRMAGGVADAVAPEEGETNLLMGVPHPYSERYCRYGRTCR